jgi:hypothetical protein
VSRRDAVRKIPLAEASPTLGCSVGRIWLRKNGRRDAPAARLERASTYGMVVRGCDDFSGGGEAGVGFFAANRGWDSDFSAARPLRRARHGCAPDLGEGVVGEGVRAETLWPHSGQRAGVARRSYPQCGQRPICERRRVRRPRQSLVAGSVADTKTTHQSGISTVSRRALPDAARRVAQGRPARAGGGGAAGVIPIPLETRAAGQHAPQAGPLNGARESWRIRIIWDCGPLAVSGAVSRAGRRYSAGT